MSPTISSGTYNLITAGSATGLNYLTLGSGTLDGVAVSLQFSGGTEQLIVGSSVPANAYWQGLSGSGLAWSTTGNW